MATIDIKNLECTRRDNLLFSDLSFQVSEGDLLQIDGINGSGKSTLLRVIAGLTLPTEGDVYWNDIPINRCRQQYQHAMSYIGHSNGVKESLTVDENLDVIHALSGTDTSLEHDAILERIDLPGMNDVLLARMSAGQKRRIGLSRLLINQSQLWLLDEPFTSLDVEGKRIIEEMIVEHCQQGGIVIFATHQAMDIPGHQVRHVHLGAQ